jgi:hypothetical protein
MKKTLFLTASLLFVLISSCSCLDLISIRPSGAYVAKKFHVGSFENVSVSNGFELIITQDPHQELVIKTYENVHDYIVVRVEGNTLKIYRDGGIFFSGNTNVRIYLSCDYLKKISGSGGSRIYLDNGWQGDDLKISLSGGGRVEGEVNLNELYLSMSGGSRSELEGVAEYFSINSSGGSVHKHYGLHAAECHASLSGGASAELFVTEFLDVTGSGGTTVRYKGNPELRTRLSGGSSVRKIY